jgi:hypothetical protein
MHNSERRAMPVAAAENGCSPSFAVTQEILELRRQLNSARVHLEVSQQLANVGSDARLYAEIQAVLVHLGDIALRLHS